MSALAFRRRRDPDDDRRIAVAPAVLVVAIRRVVVPGRVTHVAVWRVAVLVVSAEHAVAVAHATDGAAAAVGPHEAPLVRDACNLGQRLFGLTHREALREGN